MPFGDGTGPRGNGPYGNGRGFGRCFNRGFGYCGRYNYLTANPVINSPSELSDQYLIAELKRIEANIALLQQEHANLEKLINEKKSSQIIK